MHRVVTLLLAGVCLAAARTHRGNRYVAPTPRKSGASGSDATAGLGLSAARRLVTNPFFNVVDYGAKGTPFTLFSDVRAALR